MRRRRGAVTLAMAPPVYDEVRASWTLLRIPTPRANGTDDVIGDGLVGVNPDDGILAANKARGMKGVGRRLIRTEHRDGEHVIGDLCRGRDISCRQHNR